MTFGRMVSFKQNISHGHLYQKRVIKGNREVTSLQPEDKDTQTQYLHESIFLTTFL